jgi:hypothetical protein
MNRIFPVLLSLTLPVVAASALRAESEKRASPREQVSAVVGGKKVTISYGRPYKKGRPIFGTLVPYGQVWRTGADEATTLTTDGDLQIGTLQVPKGSYGLFTVPGEKEWTLVVNKVSDQWGAYKYEAAKDLGRTPMTASQAKAPAEQLTITVDAKAGQLRVAWDTTVATVPIKAR